MSLYNGYFAERFMLDPSGKLVILLDTIDAGKKSNPHKEQDLSAKKFKAAFRIIDQFLAKLAKVEEVDFNKLRDQGKVTFGGSKIPKEWTKQKYINLVKREKESKWINVVQGTFESSMKSFAKHTKIDPIKSYDQFVFSSHGADAFNLEVGKKSVSSLTVYDELSKLPKNKAKIEIFACLWRVKAIIYKGVLNPKGNLYFNKDGVLCGIKFRPIFVTHHYSSMNEDGKLINKYLIPLRNSEDRDYEEGHQREGPDPYENMDLNDATWKELQDKYY